SRKPIVCSSERNPVGCFGHSHAISPSWLKTILWPSAMAWRTTRCASVNLLITASCRGWGGERHPVGGDHMRVHVPSVFVVIDAAPKLESLAVRIESGAGLPAVFFDPRLELRPILRRCLNRTPLRMLPSPGFMGLAEGGGGFVHEFK